MKLFDKLRLSLCVNKDTQMDIEKAGYGTPVKVLSNYRGSGYIDSEFVPRNITYTHVSIHETICLTDKGKKVKICKMFTNNDNICNHCSEEIQLV